MQNKKVLLIILGLLAVIAVSVYLNRPPGLDSINPLPTAKGNESEQNLDSIKDNTPEQLPNVNPSLVKGHGDLAFVSKGLLYMINGSTGIKAAD